MGIVHSCKMHTECTEFISLWRWPHVCWRSFLLSPWSAYAHAHTQQQQCVNNPGSVSWEWSLLQLVETISCGREKNSARNINKKEKSEWKIKSYLSFFAFFFSGDEKHNAWPKKRHKIRFTYTKFSRSAGQLWALAPVSTRTSWLYVMQYTRIHKQHTLCKTLHIKRHDRHYMHTSYAFVWNITTPKLKKRDRGRREREEETTQKKRNQNEST